jgi:hypothetical protein
MAYSFGGHEAKLSNRTFVVTQRVQIVTRSLSLSLRSYECNALQTPVTGLCGAIVVLVLNTSHDRHVSIFYKIYSFC